MLGCDAKNCDDSVEIASRTSRFCCVSASAGERPRPLTRTALKPPVGFKLKRGADIWDVWDVCG